MKSGIFELIENWENNETSAISNAMELLEYADSLGFDEAWIGEHHFNAFTLCPAPIALMSHALARTKHIKIGSAAILLPHCHPIKLAEEIATLDLLSKGRFLFGFARGAFSIFDVAMGGNPTQNHKIMLENATIIYDLLFKHQAHFEGEFFAIKHISIRPHPKRFIPFFIASLHQDTLKSAAKKGYNFLGTFTLSIQQAKEIYELFIQNGATKTFEFMLTRAIYIDEARNVAEEKAQIAADIFSQCMLRKNEANPILEEKIKGNNYDSFKTNFFSQR